MTLNQPRSFPKRRGGGAKKATWLRLYTEILDDFDIEKLSDAQFRLLVKLWCIARMNDGFLPSVDRIAFRLRQPEDVIKSGVSDLKRLGYLEAIEGVLTPHNWANRQFESDHSADRVLRYRKRRSGVTGNGDCNGQVALHETPPETETETETEYRDAQPLHAAQQNAPDLSNIAQQMHQRHPHRKGSVEAVESALADVASDAVDPEAVARDIQARHARWTASEDWAKENHKFCPGLSKWIRSEHRFDDPPESVKPRDPYMSLADLKRVSGGAA